MQRSLIRLHARPAIFPTLHRVTTSGIQARHAGHARHKSYFSYEVGERGQEEHVNNRSSRNAAHFHRRKVCSVKSDEHEITKRTNEEGEDQATATSKKRKNGTDGPRILRIKYDDKLVRRGFRKLELNRVRTIGSTPVRRIESLRVRADHGPLPFVDEAVESPETTNDEQDAAQETDAWGKSPEIWLSLLQREARTKGHEGIEQVWTLMKEAYVELPVKGAQASRFWTTLLSNPALHDDLLSYAIDLRSRTGRTWPPLYSLIMRFVIRTGSPERMLASHQRLVREYIIPRDALKSLAVPASISSPILGLEAFRTIYEDLHKQCDPIYDHIIPALLRAGKFRPALRWHNVLERNNDNPSAEVSKTNVIQIFQQLRQSLSQRRRMKTRQMQVRDLQRAAIACGLFKTVDDIAESTATEEQLVTSTLESSLSGHTTYTPAVSVPSTKAMEENTAPLPAIASSKRGLFTSLFTEMQNVGEKGFSDEFSARLFATKALTVSWVTSFLHAFNVKKIGPLALRAVGLRCESTKEFQYYIAEFGKNGISIGSSLFCRAVKKFADDGQVSMLKNLLNSNQHPENYDDKKLQHTVLVSAMAQRDRPTVRLSLALLSMFSPDPKQKTMNALLRGYIELRYIKGVQTLSDRMKTEGVKITQSTIAHAMKYLLRPRLLAKRPNMLDSRFQFDDLGLVTNLTLRALQGGTELLEWHWVELFKRHAMKNFVSLERFCHATIDAYQLLRDKARYIEPARTTGHVSVEIPDTIPDDHVIRVSLPFGDTANPLHYFFTQRRMQYIIAWGFHEGRRRLSVFRQRSVHPSVRRGTESQIARESSWPSSLLPPPPSTTFLCGLDVVQRLAEQGIPVTTTAVEWVLKERLWTLFGPGRSSRRVNVDAMALNPYGVVEILRAADEQWRGPTLFAEVRDMLQPVQLGDDPAGGIDFGTKSGSLSKYVPVWGNKARDMADKQLRMRTQALIILFSGRRTLGFGYRQEETRRLDSKQWKALLYKWASREARKRPYA